MRPNPKRQKYRATKIMPAKRARIPQGHIGGGECHYCKAHFARLTRDHVVPRARRGCDAAWNIVLACMGCNNKKADDWPTCECEFCLNAVARHPRARRPYPAPSQTQNARI